MKIVFLAPLPPPITGHSLASQVLYEGLKDFHEIDVINLSKDSFQAGIDSFDRVKEVLQILKQTFKKRKSADLIYLTISESFAGNLKDLFVYLICYSKLSKFYIHLHGGSIQKLLFEKSKLVFAINRFFLKKVAGIIVLGESHVQIFSSFISDKKIYIVPNFAQDFLFRTEDEVANKFDQKHDKINLLFLSNMQLEKGYNEIVDALLLLPKQEQERFNLNFAGRFDIPSEEVNFKKKIKGISNINYHGTVHGEIKKQLLKEAHVFCLPTSFLEGQPVSILEAYASGCVVMSTLKGGIVDVFEDQVNGFEIEQSGLSIAKKLKELLNQKKKLKDIGLYNRNNAFEKYRTTMYCNAVKKIIEERGIKNA